MGGGGGGAGGAMQTDTHDPRVLRNRTCWRNTRLRFLFFSVHDSSAGEHPSQRHLDTPTFFCSLPEITAEAKIGKIKNLPRQSLPVQRKIRNLIRNFFSLSLSILLFLVGCRNSFRIRLAPQDMDVALEL